MSKRASPQRILPSGVTLLEVIISLILVSTIVLVSITASANLLRNKSVSMESIHGHELAFQILDEVTAAAFEDPDDEPVFGREPDETAMNRTDFDDVDDYHNYVAAPPTHRDGTAITGLSGWSFTVTVTPAAATAEGIAILADLPAPLRRVTVTYSAPSGYSDSESMLVSDVPRNLSPETVYEEWRRATLQFPDGRIIEVTAPLRNAPVPTNG